MSKSATVRNGRFATVYGVKRDPSLDDKNIIRNKKEVKFPFIAGSSYKGEWATNAKEGFGIQVECNGDKYEGEWVRDKKHGKGTLWSKKGKNHVKQYEGSWEEDYMCGYGVFYYRDGGVYKGNWIDNKRNGRGRMEYADGDAYEGDWSDDRRNGEGTHYFANGNIYEGYWISDMKEGPGKYLYAATRKVYLGEWAEDQPQCGEYRNPTEAEELMFRDPSVWSTSFDLPTLSLEQPRAVLDQSIAGIRCKRANARGLSNEDVTPEAIDNAATEFYKISKELGLDSLVPLRNLEKVLIALGKQIDGAALEQLASNLDLDIDQQLAFPEVIDLAGFVSNISEDTYAY